MTKDNVTKMFRNYAAIDVGSNAVRLLIKRFEKNGDVVFSSKEQLVRVPLRLGFEVFKDNKISKEKEKDLARLIRAFIYIMKIYDVKEYMACATSALRDARNGKDVVKRIKDKTGVKINILNGQEEAKEIFFSHVMYGKSNCMYVDVGGGSTEVSIVSDGDLVYSRSFNIGTIRMLCDVVNDREWRSLRDDITELMGTYKDMRVIGSGGNINKIYRLIESRDRQQKRITVKALGELFDVLKGMSVEDRVRTYGMRYDRADVIVPAASIFLTIAGILNTEFIYVPTIGISDGMINTLFERRLKKFGRRLDGNGYEGDIKDINDVKVVPEQTDDSAELPSGNLSEDVLLGLDDNVTR